MLLFSGCFILIMIIVVPSSKHFIIVQFEINQQNKTLTNLTTSKSSVHDSDNNQNIEINKANEDGETLLHIPAKYKILAFFHRH